MSASWPSVYVAKKAVSNFIGWVEKTEQENLSLVIIGFCLAHPMLCYDPQQLFDHSLFVCWHLRRSSCASYRVDGCERHPDKVCGITHFVSLMKKCRNFHSIVSLRSHFEIHNNNKYFSTISQSQSIGWVKQKPDNNCQTIRIITKILFFFSAHSVCRSLAKKKIHYYCCLQE